MSVPVKYKFTEDFFRDEVRTGFTVSECMKRYWAASLHSLEIFDDICKRHGLKYFADCGTMLGAVRHKGFIPWDDDIDIGMLRKDFDEFLRIAPDELPPEYVISVKDDPPRHQYNGIAVVNSLRAVSFDAKVLDEYYYCPFPVGFDLYPYDYVPDDKNDRDVWRGKYLKLLIAFKLMKEKPEGDSETQKTLKELGIDPGLAMSDPGIVRNKLFDMAEHIAGENDDSCGSYVNRLIFLAMNDYHPALNKEWYSDIMELPFETGSIPVLRHADEVLSIAFGSGWMTPRMGTMSHDYPLYKRDIRHMIAFLEKGGLKLSLLPPQLGYIVREADALGIEYTK